MGRNFTALFLICGLTSFGQAALMGTVSERYSALTAAPSRIVVTHWLDIKTENLEAKTGSASEENAPYADHRAWQHGINFVKMGDRHLLIWSSWNNPPAPVKTPEGNWQHDVYYSWIDPDRPSLDAHTLASGPEAQEPASAAVNASGRLLMSCEDGDGEINQHAGVWDSNLNPIKAYPFMVRKGGHSGHVAALGDKFLNVYSEGWIDGGGVDNLGTGDDVMARVLDGDGNLVGEEIKTSVNPDPQYRDWWPVVAASDRNWLEVWQRYPSGTLHGAIITPDGAVQTRFQITDNLTFYHYNVTYLPSLHLYAVMGSRQDGGFISLVDRDGGIVATQTGLPPTVRESRLIAEPRGNAVLALYPVRPHGVAVLQITEQRIDLIRTVDHPYPWDYTGTDGVFIDPHKALFATLSKEGVQFLTVDGL